MKFNIEITLSKIMAYAVFTWGVYSGKVIEALPFIVVLISGKQAFDYLKSNSSRKSNT
jgi:hypothetical protein